jgi:exopolyphosphatase/pppGpp-phosphohydrolase
LGWWWPHTQRDKLIAVYAVSQQQKTKIRFWVSSQTLRSIQNVEQAMKDYPSEAVSPSNSRVMYKRQHHAAEECVKLSKLCKMSDESAVNAKRSTTWKRKWMLLSMMIMALCARQVDVPMMMMMMPEQKSG